LISIITIIILKMIKILKQTKITDYYKAIKIYGYNAITDEFHCMVCGIPLGKNNPRQLCYKSYCPYTD
jgi:hypothetical protein